MQNYVTFVETILKKPSKTINDWKFRDHCNYTLNYRVAVRSICNLRFSVPNEIPIVFHKRFKFERQFECLGRSTQK